MESQGPLSSAGRLHLCLSGHWEKVLIRSQSPGQTMAKWGRSGGRERGGVGEEF